MDGVVTNGRNEMKRIVLLAWICLMLLFQAAWAGAGRGDSSAVDPDSRKVNLAEGKSTVIRTRQPVTRVSVADDKIADYVLLSPSQIYVTAKGVGITNVTLWTAKDEILAVYDVEVAPDITRLKSKLRQILPEENGIQVKTTDDSITLSGKASNTAAVAQAKAIAEAYASKDTKIINLLDAGGIHQVMLEVRVAEMSKSLINRLGINFVVGNEGSIGTSLLGNLATIKEFVGSGEAGSLELDISQTVNSLFHIAAGDFTWTQFMDALKEDGIIKILAEPTLITQSGQTANFLAGGEFPVPVPQGLGTVAIEYKSFGVGLTFTPTVLSDQRINLKVMPEVSELDFTTAVNIQGYTIPGLSTRRVSTVIELADGQSFAIAGLLRDSVRESIKKFPLLGQIPILGMLFRSNEFQRNQTELLVVVTPHLVKPIDKARVTLPTDHYVQPSDTEFFIYGLMEGRGGTPPSSPVPPPGGRSGLQGEFGHSIPR
ncbi:pilus assembly protein CpaC [Desulforhabdus sp. TSK]|nr:pilus assembly protein CpaC [Desulforhabdus sp. TSK]